MHYVKLTCTESGAPNTGYPILIWACTWKGPQCI